MNKCSLVSMTILINGKRVTLDLKEFVNATIEIENIYKYESLLDANILTGKTIKLTGSTKELLCDSKTT